MNDEVKSTLISSLSELDSTDAFVAIVVVPVGGMALQALSIDNSAPLGEKVRWMEVGTEKHLTSFEVVSNWMACTDNPFKARIIDFEDS